MFRVEVPGDMVLGSDVGPFLVNPGQVDLGYVLVIDFNGYPHQRLLRSPAGMQFVVLWGRPRHIPEVAWYPCDCCIPIATKPLHCKGFSGTPGGTRTPNLLIRNQTLYPN
jgi:hypothetical protein